MCNNYQSNFGKQLCCSNQLYIIDHYNDNAKETFIRGLWGQERSEKERKKGELYIIRWSLQISTKTKREAKKRGEKERKCPVMMTCLHNAHQRLLSFIHCHVQHQTQVHKIFCKW